MCASAKSSASTEFLSGSLDRLQHNLKKGRSGQRNELGRRAWRGAAPHPNKVMDKNTWQKRQRAKFLAEHGYSMTAHYRAGTLRQAVLVRDSFACVVCHMTDAEHKAKWQRPITVDHKDRDRSNNTMKNLQTLCLSCHGRKDQLPQLKARALDKYKFMIMDIRQNYGTTYQVIAKHFRVSVGCVYNSIQRWGKERL